MFGEFFNQIIDSGVRIGDEGNNVLNGTNSSNQLLGLSGNDRLKGMAGADLLEGGTGNDWLYGGKGQDLLKGGAGNDWLYGGKGQDRLEGGAGNDLLVGGLGNDILVGGAGNDIVVLAPGSGSDTLIDFQNGQDKIQLEGGLTFDDLDILSQGANNTDIFINKAGDPNDGEKLATLIRVHPKQLTKADFISAPTITSTFTASVPENQIGAINVETSDDSDSEGSGLTYSISGGADAALFSINADNGVVTFNNAPNFEAPGDTNGDNNYDVEVTVTDSDGLTDTQTVTISVTDIAEDAASTNNIQSLQATNNIKDLKSFLKRNRKVDFRTANLLKNSTLDSYNWKGLEDNKESVIFQLKAYQRLLRIVPNGQEDVAIKLLQEGFHSSLQIANTPKAKFLQDTHSIFSGDTTLAEQLYKRALAVRKLVILKYLNQAQ
ncbi:cadherin domain-containing protein [Adonisia turfae]|uniref:cadherin domain-containing protein n=1 Tax=Adonisia turfae TaxID=2950184 RepID=UPI0013D1A5DC|nr:cadherin domain-containing protein [Adonisia turfae]